MTTADKAESECSVNDSFSACEVPVPDCCEQQAGKKQSPIEAAFGTPEPPSQGITTSDAADKGTKYDQPNLSGESDCNDPEPIALSSEESEQDSESYYLDSSKKFKIRCIMSGEFDKYHSHQKKNKALQKHETFLYIL